MRRHRCPRPRAMARSLIPGGLFVPDLPNRARLQYRFHLLRGVRPTPLHQEGPAVSQWQRAPCLALSLALSYRAPLNCQNSPLVNVLYATFLVHVRCAINLRWIPICRMSNAVLNVKINRQFKRKSIDRGLHINNLYSCDVSVNAPTTAVGVVYRGENALTKLTFIVTHLLET